MCNMLLCCSLLLRPWLLVVVAYRYAAVSFSILAPAGIRNQKSKKEESIGIRLLVINNLLLY